MTKTLRIALILVFGSFFSASIGAKPVHHYVFLGQDREKRKDPAIMDTKAFEGAQIAYTWKELEPRKDQYDFSAIEEDLKFLHSNQRKLFVQLQDVTFQPSRINIPRYLLDDPNYNGGAYRQYQINDQADEHAVLEGWMMRRWDPAVQKRFYKLLFALGKEFDGRIEGINFAETSSGVGRTGRYFPEGFSFEVYRDGIIANMRALKRAFPKSVVIQYANFMPGEWLPTEDKGYLRAVYKAAHELKVGVGGPDLLPFRQPQLDHAYRLIRASAGIVKSGIAVQDGNYDDVDTKTGERTSVPQLIKFAVDHLHVDYIFWCTQEPFFSHDLLTNLRAKKQR